LEDFLMPERFFLEIAFSFCSNELAARAMKSAGLIAEPERLSPSQRTALLSLLSDDDPVIYRTVREKILSFGAEAADWLRPHVLSREPVLRRRAQEIVLHFVHSQRLNGAGATLMDQKIVSVELFVDTAAYLQAIGRAAPG